MPKQEFCTIQFIYFNHAHQERIILIFKYILNSLVLQIYTNPQEKQGVTVGLQAV
jgi:hypothetical protein